MFSAVWKPPARDDTSAMGACGLPLDGFWLSFVGVSPRLLPAVLVVQPVVMVLFTLHTPQQMMMNVSFERRLNRHEDRVVT